MCYNFCVLTDITIVSVEQHEAGHGAPLVDSVDSLVMERLMQLLETTTITHTNTATGTTTTTCPGMFVHVMCNYVCLVDDIQIVSTFILFLCAFYFQMMQRQQ